MICLSSAFVHAKSITKNSDFTVLNKNSQKFYHEHTNNDKPKKQYKKKRIITNQLTATASACAASTQKTKPNHHKTTPITAVVYCTSNSATCHETEGRDTTRMALRAANWR